MLLWILTLCSSYVIQPQAAPAKGFEGYGEKHASIDQIFAEINVGPKNVNPLLGETSPGTLREYDIMDPPSSSTRKRRGIGTYAKWLNGEIPYVFDSGFDGTNADFVRVFDAAKQQFLDKTCLKLVPRTTQSKFVTIVSDGGCWSYVGMVAQVSVQKVSLLAPKPGFGHCWYTGIIIHEFMHAFGVSHEQSRADRDEHVTIVWSAIPSDKQNNFQKMTNWVDTGSPYDYTSVMHYGKAAFGNPFGTVTIVTKDASKQNVIGQRAGMSDNDAAQLSALYSCPVPTTPAPTTPAPTTPAPTTPAPTTPAPTTPAPTTPAPTTPAPTTQIPGTTKTPIKTVHGVDLNKIQIAVGGFATYIEFNVMLYILHVA